MFPTLSSQFPSFTKRSKLFSCIFLWVILDTFGCRYVQVSLSGTQRYGKLIIQSVTWCGVCDVTWCDVTWCDGIHLVSVNQHTDCSLHSPSSTFPTVWPLILSIHRVLLWAVHSHKGRYYVQGEAIESGDSQVAVLVNCAEYKKQKILQSISSKIPFNICIIIFKNYFFNLSPRHAMRSYNPARKLAVTARRHTTFHRRCGTSVRVEFWISSRQRTKQHVRVEITANGNGLLWVYV